MHELRNNFAYAMESWQNHEFSLQKINSQRWAVHTFVFFVNKKIWIQFNLNFKAGYSRIW